MCNLYTTDLCLHLVRSSRAAEVLRALEVRPAIVTSSQKCTRALPRVRRCVIVGLRLLGPLRRKEPSAPPPTNEHFGVDGASRVGLGSLGNRLLNI